MDATELYSLQSKALQVRYRKTLHFVKQSLPPGTSILDIGIDNPFSKILREEGYRVVNTSGEDLDEHPEAASAPADVATAFEIFEHLLNPLGVLKNISADRLFASVPLSLWFAKAYRHPVDQWDRHFHEFEDWQFDWLLNKAGWEIVRKEKWISPAKHIGLRPLLRLFVPRYYMIEAKRKK